MCFKARPISISWTLRHPPSIRTPVEEALGRGSQGLGFVVWGLGSGVWGLGGRVPGFGFRGSGFGFRAPEQREVQVGPD